MKITVSEQSKRFYLASREWVPAVGHEIRVGRYRFCAIPFSNIINVSEVTSGCKVFNIPMSLGVLLETPTKESSIKFFYRVGESLKRIISKTENFDIKLAEMKKVAFEQLGEMPAIEKIDIDWVFEDISDVLN